MVLKAPMFWRCRQSTPGGLEVDLKRGAGDMDGRCRSSGLTRKVSRFGVRLLSEAWEMDLRPRKVGLSRLAEVFHSNYIVIT